MCLNVLDLSLELVRMCVCERERVCVCMWLCVCICVCMCVSSVGALVKGRGYLHASCYTYSWVRRMSHVTQVNTSCHTSCHTSKDLMPHTCKIHVTHMNESCHTHVWNESFTCKWFMSHIWIIYVIPMNPQLSLCHTHTPSLSLSLALSLGPTLPFTPILPPPLPPPSLFSLACVSDIIHVTRISPSALTLPYTNFHTNFPSFPRVRPPFSSCSQRCAKQKR